ncbi:MAG: quinone-dependent dihydroorotate dehydrogenase [Polyangia bacterium]
MSTSLLSRLLFFMPAERAHHVGSWLLRALFALPLIGWALRTMLRPRGAVRVMGLEFPGPLGVAAGFDKDARMYDALLGLGFSFVEVGTLTPRPQPGNPQPRMFRLPADRALLNRLGFNNGGVEAALPRLRRRRRGIVGVNIGKNKDTPDADAATDYAACARAVAPYADYVVVNVSSPNTPGLRALQTTEALRPILIATRAALDSTAPARAVPLLCKIAPDLSNDELDAIVELALELGLTGLVATNTTISREGLSSDVSALGAGGVSGAPLKSRALDVLKRLRARAPGLVLVSVGGIESRDDVRERLQAGADLLEAYTGFVYGGPLYAWTLQRR